VVAPASAEPIVRIVALVNALIVVGSFKTLNTGAVEVRSAPVISTSPVIVAFPPTVKLVPIAAEVVTVREPLPELPIVVLPVWASTKNSVEPSGSKPFLMVKSSPMVSLPPNLRSPPTERTPSMLRSELKSASPLTSRVPLM